MNDLRRHSLVRLSQAPQAAGDADRALAERWQALRRPFVIARSDGDRSAVALGFCVAEDRPPAVRPRRVAARSDPRHILDVARPPPLDAIARCPAAQPHAAAFARLAEVVGADFSLLRVLELKLSCSILVGARLSSSASWR